MVDSTHGGQFLVTRPWSNVDRMLGSGIALCGLAIVLLNSLAFVDQAGQFASWWLALACVSPSIQLVNVLGWKRLSPTTLRTIWRVHPPLLFFSLFFTYCAWQGGGQPPSPQIWLIDSTTVGVFALTVRGVWAAGMTMLLAAAVPLSALVFLGDVPDPVLSWGFAHAFNVIFIMVALVLRRQMIMLDQANRMAEQLRDEEARILAEESDFKHFSRVVHDEVLASFAAALQFNGEPPALLRRSATVAAQALQSLEHKPETEAMELTSDNAAQLIVDLIGVAAPVHLTSKVLPGDVLSVAAGAVGLAAAEAARNAVRHAGGGTGTVLVGDDSIRVIIVDSGQGFDLSTIDSRRLGIRESVIRRMEELPGGSAIFDSNMFGTTVVMTWNRHLG